MCIFESALSIWKAAFLMHLQPNFKSIYLMIISHLCLQVPCSNRNVHCCCFVINNPRNFLSVLLDSEFKVFFFLFSSLFTIPDPALGWIISHPPVSPVTGGLLLSSGGLIKRVVCYFQHFLNPVTLNKAAQSHRRKIHPNHVTQPLCQTFVLFVAVVVIINCLWNPACFPTLPLH